MAGIKYQPSPAWPWSATSQSTHPQFSQNSPRKSYLEPKVLASTCRLLYKHHFITAEPGFYFLLHTKSELKTWDRLTQPQLSQGHWAREWDWTGPTAAASQSQCARGLVWFKDSARPEIEFGVWRIYIQIKQINSQIYLKTPNLNFPATIGKPESEVPSPNKVPSL